MLIYLMLIYFNEFYNCRTISNLQDSRIVTTLVPIPTTISQSIPPTYSYLPGNKAVFNELSVETGTS